MPKTREQKKEVIKFYKSKLESASAIYMIESSQISANEANEIKQSLYENDSTYNVVKNKLFEIALDESGYEKRDDLKGQHGVIFASEDKISEAAKVIYEFLKTKAKEQKIELDFIGGYLNKEILTVAEVKELAELPNRDQLIGIFVRTLNAPISGFANALADNIKKFGYALNAVKDQKEAA